MLISVVDGVLSLSIEQSYEVRLHLTLRQPGGEMVWYRYWVLLAFAGTVLAAGSAGPAASTVPANANAKLSAAQSSTHSTSGCFRHVPQW